ncbi:MAG: hypothetical protein EOP09_09435 [Proteobacteria bacterium]|nr:MAG: hypothetical protein EOP09_09435 [Pseudomonadota bacterium]
MNGEGRQELQLESTLRAVRTEIQSAIREGKIASSEALIPTRIYFTNRVPMNQTTLADLHFAAPGEAVPAGYQIFNGLLPLKLFYEVLSLGHFPVSAPHDVLVEGITVEEGAYMHDLNHLSAMTQDYSYMAQLRSTAKEILRGDGPDRTAAYEYFSEFMNLIHPQYQEATKQKIAEIKMKLGATGIGIASYEKIGQFSTPVGQYKLKLLGNLKAADPAVLTQILELKQLAHARNFWAPYGGAARSVEFRYGTLKHFAHMEAFAPLMTRDRPDISYEVQASFENWDPRSEAGLRAAVAFLVRLEQLSEVNKESVHATLFSDDPSAIKELRRLCKTGFFSPAICRRF